MKWIGAAYFPRSQQQFRTIKTKFLTDLKGVDTNNVDGIAFIINQEISVTERKKLMLLKDCKIEIYHLERIVSILNNPSNYGIRLEFLDISITPEEQIAFFAERDKKYLSLSDKFEEFMVSHRPQESKALADSEDDEDHTFSFEKRTEDEIGEAIEELLN
ncbi:hypothetical protein D3C76_404630 [compost metagenome]